MLIKCEGKSLPIYWYAYFFELFIDSASKFLLPFPSSFSELRSSYIVSCLLILFPKHVFDYGLGGYACMILTRKPATFVVIHSLPSGYCVLNWEHQGMTDMECSSDIWRWNYHCKLFQWISILAMLEYFFCGCVEKLSLLPPGVPCWLDVFWIVRGRHSKMKLFFLSLRCVINELFFLFFLRRWDFFLGLNSFYLINNDDDDDDEYIFELRRVNIPLLPYLQLLLERDLLKP